MGLGTHGAGSLDGSGQGRIQGFPKGGVETRDTKCGGGGGGVLSALDPTRKAGGGGGGGVLPTTGPIQKAGGGGGVAVHLRPDTKSGGGGGVLSSASGPIQKAGKGEGLFSRRGSVTIYERGVATPKPPPPPLDPPLLGIHGAGSLGGSGYP